MTTNQNEEGADEFEDAIEAFDVTNVNRSVPSPVTEGMTLDVALTDSRHAVNLFFNNKFDEARAIMEPWSSTSFYHALGMGVFSFLQAVLTFEQKDMEAAAEVVKHSIELSNQFRRKNTVSESFGRLLKKPDYDAFTEDQIHAELCYAESLLFKAVLTFTEDETLISFVKGGLKIRSCYQSYKECWHILNNRKWMNDRHKIHFESGVRLGAGAFNLLISLLPQRILKLLEFIGFNGGRSSRDMGLRELEKGYQQQESIRRVMCAMILLGYHLMILYVLGTGEGNLIQARNILDEQLKLYPNGAWFLFFQGRLEFVQAHVDSAIEWYNKSWKSQEIWPQFHHICYWELMWAHSLKLDWTSASDYAQRLFTESKWSRSIYAYQQAAFMCMQKDEGSLSGEDYRHLVKLMREVPVYKQRIAGKSLPMEKFVIKKSARYFAQNERLCLPALELIYVWNCIRIMGKDWALVQSSYRLIERTLKDLDKLKKEKYYWDDLGLVLLLKGCCLRYMGSPLQAEECFLKVTKMDKQIVDDHYLIPYSVAELGFLYQSMEKTEQAIVWLEAAKNNYKGYSLESRLHFRLHSALTQLRSLPTDRPNADGSSEMVMGLDDTLDQLSCGDEK